MCGSSILEDVASVIGIESLLLNFAESTPNSEPSESQFSRFDPIRKILVSTISLIDGNSRPGAAGLSIPVPENQQGVGPDICLSVKVSFITPDSEPSESQFSRFDPNRWTLGYRWQR